MGWDFDSLSTTLYPLSLHLPSTDIHNTTTEQFKMQGFFQKKLVIFYVSTKNNQSFLYNTTNTCVKLSQMVPKTPIYGFTKNLLILNIFFIFVSTRHHFCSIFRFWVSTGCHPALLSHDTCDIQYHRQYHQSHGDHH